MAKFVEGTTGEDGLIAVPGFWTRNPFAKERTLTVYKPGHVMWNQEYVFPEIRSTLPGTYPPVPKPVPGAPTDLHCQVRETGPTSISYPTPIQGVTSI